MASGLVGFGSLTLSLAASGREGGLSANISTASYAYSSFWCPVLTATPSIYWTSSGTQGQLFYLDVFGYRYAR